MPETDRAGLVESVRVLGDRDALLAAEDLEAGASLAVSFDGPLPGSRFASIYGRRARHLAERGAEVSGIEQAVSRLTVAPEVDGLALVRARQRHHTALLHDVALVAVITAPVDWSEFENGE